MTEWWDCHYPGNIMCVWCHSQQKYVCFKLEGFSLSPRNYYFFPQENNFLNTAPLILLKSIVVRSKDLMWKDLNSVFSLLSNSDSSGCCLTCFELRFPHTWNRNTFSLACPDDQVRWHEKEYFKYKVPCKCELLDLYMLLRIGQWEVLPHQQGSLDPEGMFWESCKTLFHSLYWCYLRIKFQVRSHK